MLRKVLNRFSLEISKNYCGLFSLSCAHLNKPIVPVRFLSEYEVVVAGGGAGGISTAARLSKLLGKEKILIIDRAVNHYYQPMWTLIGAGAKPLEYCRKPMKDVIPSGVDHMHQKISEIDPENNTVFLENGEKVRYKYLVCALGIRVRFDWIKGLPEAFDTPGVCSNFTVHTVTKTLPAMQDFKSGNAIFTFPPPPIKCPGAPQKIMYMAEEYFRKHEKRNEATIMFNSADKKIFSVKKYAEALMEVVEKRDIKLNFGLNLTEVKPDTNEAVFENLSQPGESFTYSYEMLHISPPMSPHECLKSSPLADAAGFVNVNKETTQHVKYPNVFALGDCSNIPTSKTAAAVGSQNAILVENLLRVRSGKKCKTSYDGYTSCPLITGYKSCILAEFDFDLQPLETFPVDQGKERRSMYHMKADVMPTIYWDYLLKGKWDGTRKYRKVFHLGLSR